MLKITRKHAMPLFAGLILLAVLLVVTAKVSYYLGERHISELVLHSDVPKKKQAYVPPTNYAEALDSIRAERDRILNDYDAACYNYQTLYNAYDKLYAKAGANSGQEKIVRPDSARGNTESCYR